MKTVTLILAATLVIVFLGCGPEMVAVKSGEKVICSECGKVIRSDIQSQQVPATEASQYTVREIAEKCSECQAKEVARARQQSIGRITGGWIWNTGLFSISVVMTLKTDGSGDMALGDNKSTLKWQPTSDGITARVNWEQPHYPRPLPRTSVISGRIFDNGNKMFVNGYGTFGFGASQTSVFEKMH